MPEPSDEFDAILAGSPPAPSASPSAAPAHSLVHDDHAVHTQAPSFAEFRESWGLYRDPVLAGVLAGAALGLLGVFVVLRRAVFVTAAVSQAAGLGVASAFLLAIVFGVSLPPVLLAFAFAGLAALLLALRPPARLPREATVGFLYLGSSALAIIVGDRISQEAHDIASILFGTAVLVRPEDLLLVGLVGALSVACVLALARGLAFAGFDPDAARVQGLPVQGLESALWLLVAAEVAVATRALGALPVFAFAVLPALGALKLARRLPQALWLGAALGALAGGLGYIAAFMLELPVGAAQATVSLLLALFAFVVASFRS